MQGIGSVQASQALDLLSAQKLRAFDAAQQGDPKKTASKFEALFATQLVKEMRKTLDDGFFGSGAGSDVYEGWLDEHLGTALARGRGLGLADSLARSLGEKAAEAKKP